MIIANIATFPGRADVLPAALERILPQVDKINICLNGYEKIPALLKSAKIEAFIPDQDYRDVGKFYLSDFNDDDDVFYMDDDIIYPCNYVETLRSFRNQYAELEPIVGLHGVIYPDFYNGSVDHRVVFAFRKALEVPRVVNQLGTGTIHCKGFQAPPLSFITGSQRFVDVRFARYTLQNGWPLLCIPRSQDWMKEIELQDSIFTNFTKSWPINVVKECQQISGYSRLPIKAVYEIEYARYS